MYVCFKYVHDVVAGKACSGIHCSTRSSPAAALMGQRGKVLMDTFMLMVLTVRVSCLPFKG